MPIAVSIIGGSVHSRALSPAERQAAQHALTRLGTSKLHLSSSAHPATVSGGVSLAKGALGASKLLSGHDLLASGAGAKLSAGIGNDTVVSGSFTAASASQKIAQGAKLSADTINVAGHTAAGVKGEEAAASKTTSTITLSDKTTVTLTGIATHNVIKPH